MAPRGRVEILFACTVALAVVAISARHAAACPVYYLPSPPSDPPSQKHHHSCFPGDALVLLEDGSQRPIGHLKIGDKVASQGPDATIVFDEVYAFAHQDAETRSQFLVLSIAGGSSVSSLELSAGHFLPTAAGPTAEPVMKRAEDVAVGDLVWVATDSSALQLRQVTEVSVSFKAGLYNPLTLSGTLLVGGVVASAHSDWFLDAAFDALHATHRLPLAYQAVLFPARLLYRALGSKAYARLYAGIDSLLGGIPNFGSRYGGLLVATTAAAAALGALQLSSKAVALARR